jgi:hypothetical protein
MGEGRFSNDGLGFDKKNDGDGKGDGIDENQGESDRDSRKAIFKPS